MIVRQRSDWTATEIASHVLEATSLSQLTLPEVKKLANRVLRDEGDGLKPDVNSPEGTRPAQTPEASGQP